METTLPARDTDPIDQKQIRQYVTEGYLVVPDLVLPHEREALKADIVALARGKYPCTDLQPADPALSDAQVLETLLCVHQPHLLSPVMRPFVDHPLLVAVLSKIVGAHLPWWNGSVKCMQSMVFVKSPGLPGQAWHQDEVYIPTRDRSLCGAWIAIDDATIANGCLWVLPGSHRSGYLYPMRDHGRLDEFDTSQECYGFDDRDEVPVEVKAGSVVFFNGYLLHRSRRNRSGVFRRALVNHYMNSYSFLPWFTAKESGQTVALADDRSIIPVSGADPYGWKGIQDLHPPWVRPYDKATILARGG
jgi:phytanoyl-CoA hydroxylase